MAVRDLIPWGRSRPQVPASLQRGEETNPFLSLHREMNRLFDDAFSRFETGMPSLFGRMQGWAGGSWPIIEANASDNEVRVVAELPGMDEKDVEIFVDDNVLIIRGERRLDGEDQGRRFSERYYGRFERSIGLPFEVEDDKAEASFTNGVLTVKLTKSAKAQDKAKRIAIGAKRDTTH